MGYALFTARKLMLQNRLNQSNYRLMMLSQQQKDLAQQSADMEMINGFRTSMNSIFASNKQSASYQDLLNDKGLTEKSMQLKMNELENDAKRTQIISQAQTQSDMGKLKSIQAIENQIDLEMKKLDTQIKETTAEMESVEKAEDQAIKASAPKYGGGGGG